MNFGCRALFKFFIIASLALLTTACKPAVIHEFAGLEGPQSTTKMPPYAPTSYEIYGKGSTSQMAILLTDEKSNWLGLAHGLKTIGVPFVMTTDYERALKHDVVFVYPIVSGRVLSADALSALASHPRQGGTLLASGVLGGGLNPVFGFENIVESQSHVRLQFNTEHEVTSDFKTLAQHDIKIGSATNTGSNPGTNAYSNPLHPPLAVYEDGSAAITQRPFETGGAAYAIGPDIGQLLQKGYNYREEDISEHYVNAYQPTLDVLLRLLLNIYQTSDSDAVTLGTVPDGKSLSVLLSHDVDYTKSIKNAVEYAKFEKAEGISATYFIQTKYVRDYNDDIFFNDEGVSYLRKLKDLGAEIGSHSVSHSLQFDDFPLGTGTEKYSSYIPFVQSRKKTKDASLLGELRVSKFLLESQLNDRDVTAFRPGFLRYPSQLPQALEWSGYRYSSTATANKSLTHFPFQLNVDRGYDTESAIFEFPITIEDEKLPKMGDRLPEAIEIADTLKQYGGTFVVLSHPDILDHKFEFEKGLVKHVKPYAWFGTMSEYGDWWTARNEIEIDVVDNGPEKIIVLDAPSPIEGLTIAVPENYVLVGTDENLAQTGRNILIGQLREKLEIRLEKQE